MDQNPVNPPHTEPSPRILGSVLVRALILLVIFLGLAVVLDPAGALGKASLYNNLIPGRERFPYGENPQKSYSMTINDLDAMFASHQVSRPKADGRIQGFHLWRFLRLGHLAFQ